MRFLRLPRHVHACEPYPALIIFLQKRPSEAHTANGRLVSADNGGIAFRWKNYREDGLAHWKTMTLKPAEFIRRVLIRVLPKGFHRIRHYGLLANANRAEWSTAPSA